MINLDICARPQVVILKMDSAVVFSDFTRPICLPSSDDFIPLGATCVTLGWGAKSELTYKCFYSQAQDRLIRIR